MVKKSTLAAERFSSGYRWTGQLCGLLSYIDQGPG